MTHSKSISNAANILLNKFSDTSALYSVFVKKDGSITQTKTTTKRFNEYMNSMGDCLMGIYDGDAHIDWIEDDLVYMGVK